MGNRTTGSSSARGWGVLLVIAVCVACQTPPTSTEPPSTVSAGATTASISLPPAVTSGAVTAGDVAAEPAGVAEARGATAAPPSWIVGKWAASGPATLTPLHLPNNQGVQLAWLKDKGKQFSGPLELSLTLDGNGEVLGELTGAIGNLKASGVWPAKGPLHLELRPAEEAVDVFHGVVTVTWDEQKQQGRARLRATSGDGYWLRAADLEVTRSS